MNETHTVIGAGGAQGGAVVRRLLREGRRVRAVTRDGRAVPGAEPFAADLLDPERLAAAFQGVARASVTLPMREDPAQAVTFATHLASAARKAGLERLVVNMGGRIPAHPTGVPLFEARREAARILLAEAPAVVLCPPVYLDNLLAPWVAGPLVREGVLGYPIPEDDPVSWMSHDDLAEATSRAMTADVAGRALDVGGPDALTGPELAAALATALHRPVVYAAQDVDAFEAGLARALGADVAEGVASTYRWSAANPSLNAGSPGMRELGVEPTPAHRWAASRNWPAA